MYPKLYHSNETNFIHNGLGLLTGTISAIATEELNGMFELNMEYDSDGFLADVIQEEMIIKAKANDKQQEQLFRIYSITKNHENDNLIIAGQHITYDLANNFVEKLEALNLTKKQVMEKIGSSTAYSHPFNVTSSNTTTQSSTSLYRTNPLQMVGGMDGSVLQIWGGQIERDNFHLIMHDRRGSDDGVLVTYKKNLTGLTAKFDISNLVTRIFPFFFKEATNDEPEKLITVPGKYIDSPNINDYEMPYILPVDFSSEQDIETSQDLLNIAKDWFKETGRDKPRVEMEVKFEHLWETEEYKDVAALELVGMGDTITVKHSKLNVEGTAIVNRIEYDVIARKNRSVDVGNVKASFTDKVNSVGKIIDRVDEIDKNANQAIRAANGKNTIYYGPDEPTDGNKDDIWFHVVDGEYTRTYRFDGIQWQRVIDKDVADIETVANDAHNRANQADATASLANQNALESLTQAQTSFDLAQEALLTGRGLTSRLEDAEGNITAINQTTESYGRRIENAEGDISTLSNTATGLQNRVANAEGDISSVTQLANAMQTDLRNAKGDINTLTETASSMQRTITSVRNDLDGLEIGGTNLNQDSNYFGRDVLTTYDGSAVSIHKENVTVEEWGATDATEIAANAGDQTSLLKVYKQITNTTSTVLGKTYTVSFYIKNLREQTMGVRVNGIDGTNTIQQVAGNEAKRIVVTGQRNTNGLQLQFRAPNTNLYTHFIVWRVQVEEGTKVTAWRPAPEEVQSQITQLADNINLRVVQKGDVINQINISTEDILISGKKLILDGDTTVTGTFRVDNANITSVDAGKMTTGILNAAQVSIINLSANSIVGGIQQSQNSNTTFNWNTGELNLVNNNITFGTGANINFESNSNTLTYRKYDSQDSITRSAGVGVGDRIGGRYPFAYLGTTGASNLDSLSPYFSGFIANSTAAIGDDATNSVNGFVFQMRNRAVDWDKGITFDFNGSRPSISTISPSTYAYDIGTFGRLFGRQAFGIVNYTNERSGWLMETAYAGNNTDITFRGNYSSEYNYQIGGNSSSNAIRNIYLRNNPIVVSDRRAKEDITDNVLGLDFINSIDTRTFRLKQKPSEVEKNKLQFGFIAQELIGSLTTHNISIEDYSIIGMGEDGLYNLKETQLIAPAIKAIQEVDDKVDLTREELLMKIAELEARVNYLEVA